MTSFTTVEHGGIYYYSFGVLLGSPNANHVMGWLHVPAGERVLVNCTDMSGSRSDRSSFALLKRRYEAEGGVPANSALQSTDSPSDMLLSHRRSLIHYTGSESVVCQYAVD